MSSHFYYWPRESLSIVCAVLLLWATLFLLLYQHVNYNERKASTVVHAHLEYIPLCQGTARMYICYFA